MTVLSAEAVSGEDTKYGKKISDIQKDIVVGDTGIMGTLIKQDSYEEWGAGASGWFLALSFETDATKLTTKVIGGSEKETDLTKDKYCVYNLTGNTQKIEVKAEKDGHTNTKTYHLKKLVFADKP